MIELLALLLAPKIAPITEPHYLVGHCYTHERLEHVNVTVKILNITKFDYEIKIYYETDDIKKWADGSGKESFNTLENVYTKEVQCP